MGNKFNDKFSKMYNIHQSKNPLSDALSKSGYVNKDITHRS